MSSPAFVAAWPLWWLKIYDKTEETSETKQSRFSGIAVLHQLDRRFLSATYLQAMGTILEIKYFSKRSVNAIPTLIFPGLDGTDLLLGRFVELAPDSLDVTECPLPDDPDLDYAALCDYFSDLICKHKTCHIIAESFSGPLGILLAHRFPGIIDQLTLVSTFATSPTPKIARMIPWSIVYRLPLPWIVARWYLVGSNNSLVPLLKHAIRKTSCKTLARRMRCLMEIDVTAQLSDLKCNIKYIRPTQDRLISQRSVDTIINANPAVTILEIDGPHLILQTQPEQAWACILD